MGVSVGGPSGGGGFGPLIQPIDESLAINAGMLTVYSEWVELDLFCKYAGEVQVANGTDPTGSPWVPYVDRLAWQLTPGDGLKQVSARYRAYEGNYSGTVQAETTLVSGATPTGAAGLCMYNLAWLIANCPTWQAWVGAASPAEAMTRIHRYMYPTPPTQLKWPFVLITEVPQDDYTAEGSGGPYSFVNMQTLYVLFEAQPEVDILTTGYEAAIIIFRNYVDAVLAEARALACTDSFFCIEDMSQFSQVSIPDPTALEDVDEDGNLDEATSMQVVYAMRAQGQG